MMVLGREDKRNNGILNAKRQLDKPKLA